MVYNPVRYSVLPGRNATIMSHAHRIKPAGTGMGSVLLQRGGPGSASAYRDIDDYISTTGRDPYKESEKIRSILPSGSGITSKLADKLSKLTTETGRRAKRITMSL